MQVGQLQPVPSAGASDVGRSAARAKAADAAISERAARLSAVGKAATSNEYATRSCETHMHVCITNILPHAFTSHFR